MIRDHDTIAAPATASGGAIAVVRVSGDDALTVCDRIFRGRQRLCDAGGYTAHYGRIVEGDRTLDDVLVTVFRAPHSYTGENSAEISCHGSRYVVSELLRLLVASGARMAAPGEFTIRAYLAGKLDLSQAEAVADLIASSSRAAHTLAANQMRGGYSEALDTLRDKLLELTSLLELELDFSEEEVEFADRTQLRETMRQIAMRIDSLRRSFKLGNAIMEGVAVAIVGAPNVGKSTLLNRLLNEERALVSDIAGTTRDVIEETANIDGVLFRFLDTAGIRSTDDRLEQMGIERTLSSISRARIVIHIVDATQLSATIASTEASTTPVLKSGLQSPETNAPERPASVAGKTAAETAGKTAADAAPATGESPLTRISLTEDLLPAPAAGPQDPTPEAEAEVGEATLPALAPGFPLRADQRLLTVVNKIDQVPGLRLPGEAHEEPAGKTPEKAHGNEYREISGEAFGEVIGKEYREMPGEAPETIPEKRPGKVLAISARSGEGVDDLLKALREAVDTDALYHGDTVVSNSRHFEALTAAHDALEAALDGLRDGLPTDLLSEEIRQVIRHLGTITGRGVIASEEVLHNIFSKFCIGK